MHGTPRTALAFPGSCIWSDPPVGRRPRDLARVVDRDARKATAGGALFTVDGEPCAYSKQTWIRLET